MHIQKLDNSPKILGKKRETCCIKVNILLTAVRARGNYWKQERKKNRIVEFSRSYQTHISLEKSIGNQLRKKWCKNLSWFNLNFWLVSKMSWQKHEVLAEMDFQLTHWPGPKPNLQHFSFERCAGCPKMPSSRRRRNWWVSQQRTHLPPTWERRERLWTGRLYQREGTRRTGKDGDNHHQLTNWIRLGVEEHGTFPGPSFFHHCLTPQHTHSFHSLTVFKVSTDGNKTNGRQAIISKFELCNLKHKGIRTLI